MMKEVLNIPNSLEIKKMLSKILLLRYIEMISTNEEIYQQIFGD